MRRQRLQAKNFSNINPTNATTLSKDKALQWITVGWDAYSGAKKPLKCGVSGHGGGQDARSEVGRGNTESWDKTRIEPTKQFTGFFLVIESLQIKFICLTWKIGINNAAASITVMFYKACSFTTATWFSRRLRWWWILILQLQTWLCRHHHHVLCQAER